MGKLYDLSGHAQLAHYAKGDTLTENQARSHVIFILVLELDLFMRVRRPAYVNNLRVLANLP